MPKQLFNQYGVVIDNDLLELEAQLFKLTNDYLYKIKDDISLTDIRAVSQFLSTAVNIACCEAMLHASMKMRDQERTQ
jgi:hypothetical protein